SPDTLGGRDSRRALVERMPVSALDTELEWNSPMYQLAVAQLDKTAERMRLDANLWTRLRSPQRAYVVSFPFRRDDYQAVETVFGYRVQRLPSSGEVSDVARPPGAG